MKKLQSITNHKVMSFYECLKSLNWKLSENKEEVLCNCKNSKIKYSGFFDTEIIECENCGKKMTDLFSPLQTGNSTCVLLKPSDYELENDENGNCRYWISEDSNKDIKNN